MKDWIIPVMLLSISMLCLLFYTNLVEKRLSARITQLEESIGINDDWQPEPWMFQPATEECDPDEHWRCWE